MGFEETRELIAQLKVADPSQRSAFITWLVISLIRDISYYVILAILIWSLGRRIIQAILTAYREASRQNA
jgi:hypothetical protein